jgi:ABC-2 type transport system permease protein
MIFGLTVTLVVLLISPAIFGSAGTGWLVLFLTLLLSVAVREVFEAQTLANFIRFPMMFLGSVFVPLASMPGWLQILARFLPLTCSVEVLRAALSGGSRATDVLELGTLATFSGVFFFSGRVHFGAAYRVIYSPEINPLLSA